MTSSLIFECSDCWVYSTALAMGSGTEEVGFTLQGLVSRYLGFDTSLYILRAIMGLIHRDYFDTIISDSGINKIKCGEAGSLPRGRYCTGPAERWSATPLPPSCNSEKSSNSVPASLVLPHLQSLMYALMHQCKSLFYVMFFLLTPVP